MEGVVDGLPLGVGEGGEEEEKREKERQGEGETRSDDLSNQSLVLGPWSFESVFIAR